MTRRPTWSRCLILAACPLVGLALVSNAEAQLQHRWRHYHRQTQPRYDCPPEPYRLGPDGGVQTMPRVGPDGRPLPADRDPSRPDATAPGDRQDRTAPDQNAQDQSLDNLFDQQQAQTANTPAPSTLASSSSSAAPSMIGDLFCGSGSSVSSLRIFAFRSTIPNTGNPLFPNVPGNSADPVTFNTMVGPTPTLEVSQDSLSTINAAIASGATSFALLENSTLTAAVAAAEGREAVFISEEAVYAVDGDPLWPLVHPADQFNLFATYDFYDNFVVNVPSPGCGFVGRVKLAENTSPMPRDRVFFNYSYFDNVPLTQNGVNVDRFVPGFEKTFFQGAMSLEMRFPFASTLSNDIIADGITNDSDVLFGNMSAVWKSLIYANPWFALSGGLQVALPTAADTHVLLSDGREVIEIENESVHLMPFFGALYTPNDRLFAQGFIQVDADANGNPISLRNFTTGNLDPAGRINDVNFLYLDASLGYWLYRSCCPCDTLTGIAPMVELHYNASLQDTDVVSAPGFQVGNFDDNIDIVNLVLGSTFEFGRNTTVTAGYTTPLSDDQDFDGELRLFLNHRFGPQDRLARAQF